MVFQHFSLFDTLTAAENVWLGPGQVVVAGRRHAAHRRGRRGVYGLDVDPLRPVHTLSVGERQRVEIVRALLTKPRLLILDEPTSVLTPQAVQALFVTLRKLATEGCSILYISHKLDEIRALCHQVHGDARRQGHGRGRSAQGDQRQPVAPDDRRRAAAAAAPRRRTPGEQVLEVRELSLARTGAFGADLDDISFEVRAGEILGIAGVSGNGQQELMAALSGEDARAPRRRRSACSASRSARHSPRRRRHEGLHFVPEERLGRGAVPSLSLAQNTLLTRTEAVAPLRLDPHQAHRGARRSI